MWRNRAASRLMAAAAALLGLAAAQTAVAAPLDTVRERGSLRLAVYRDFPPFSSGQGQAVRGVDVELGREIAARLGLKPEFMLLTADENVDDDLRNGVWKGSVVGGPVADVMLHVPYDRQLDIRNDLVVIFGPYFEERLVVARREDTPSLPTLNGEAIGVEIDSLADLYLSGAFGGRLRDTLRRYLNLTEAGEALRRGEITGLVGPRAEVEAALGDLNGDFKLSAPPTPGLLKASWPLGMAVKHDSRDLAYAVGDIVAAMVEDGTVAAIFARHGLTYVRPR